jgi:membrane dipeptidase
VTFDAIAYHHATLVIDTHADTPQRFLDEGWGFAGPLGTGMISLDTARAGGLDAEFFAVWVEPRQYAGQYASRTFELIEAVSVEVHRNKARMRLCRSPKEILAARAEGKFAALIGIEGGHSIENSLENLRAFYKLGVRYMTLTWSNTNEWADSSGDQADDTVAHHNGLTKFGREVVREMNRLGMMVDVSHVADKTFDDVLAVTSAPVIASHSSARALTNVPRNLTDAQLQAIAKNSGAVMVNFFPAFIDNAWRAGWAAMAEERHAAQRELEIQMHAQGKPVTFAQQNAIDRRFTARIPRAPFASLIDHIDHVAKTAGVDHVGIGTDFDGIPALPEGIDSAADLPKVTAALMERGYTASDMEKFLGGNLMRVFRNVQAAAQDGSK